MLRIFTVLILMLLMSTPVIFDFKKDSALTSWRIVNDGVMGGMSQSQFDLDSEGHGRFSGQISLENNGGFASVRHDMEPRDISSYTKVRIRCKGDGKRYQFRVKANRRDYYSYVTEFKTSGEWEDVLIDLHEMEPRFRGRDLNLPNYNHRDGLAEVTFLIANKKSESFTILLDKIDLLP